MSIDHKRVVASADADSKYFGGPAEPLSGSKEREYTGPLWPINLRVVLPPFSRIFWMDPAIPVPMSTEVALLIDALTISY